MEHVFYVNTRKENEDVFFLLTFISKTDNNFSFISLICKQNTIEIIVKFTMCFLNVYSADIEMKYHINILSTATTLN